MKPKDAKTDVVLSLSDVMNAVHILATDIAKSPMATISRYDKVTGKLESTLKFMVNHIEIKESTPRQHDHRNQVQHR